MDPFAQTQANEVGETDPEEDLDMLDIRQFLDPAGQQTLGNGQSLDTMNMMPDMSSSPYSMRNMQNIQHSQMGQVCHLDYHS